MIISFGVGGLRISKKGIWDGSTYYHTISPTLLYKMWFSRKRDCSTCGRWVVINNLIVWFEKVKREDVIN